MWSPDSGAWSPEAPLQQPSKLDSFPKELLKHVIHFVDTQDRAIRESEIPRADKPRNTAREELPDGIWSYWYGHGVSALSLVDKRFRELTLPLFCDTVTAKQLTEPIFQFDHVPPALLAGIATLDLSGATPDSYAAAALALPDLPNLRSLVYGAGLLDRIISGDVNERGVYQPDRIVRREYATEAFKAAVDRFTELKVHGVMHYTQLKDELEAVCNLKALRRLHLVATHWPLLHANEHVIFPVLGAAGSLAELTIDSFEAYGGTPTVVPGRVSLTTLRSLTLHSTGEICILPFITQLAPNVQNLDIAFNSHVLLHLRAGNVAVLPSLTRLRLAGSSQCGLALARVDVATLLSLELSIDTSTTGSVDCSDIIPETVVLPAGLKFHPRSHHLIALHNLDALEARCSAANIVFTHTVHSPLSAFSPLPYIHVLDSPEEASQPRYDAVMQALKWAEERVQRLWAARDVAGVQELAEASRKVAERKVLETL